MNKSRVKHVNYGKKRTFLLTLVAILSVSICVLGSIIGYKIYTKQSFEQKIESLQNEKEIQFGQGNQKDHFRKGQAEVVAYYPLKGEQANSSIKGIMTQDIKEKLEDKDTLVFYYTEKQDSALKGVSDYNVIKQVYDLASFKVEETEKTTLAKFHLTEDGKSFTLNQLFLDTSKAKEIFLKEIKAFLMDKKLDKEKLDQLVKGFSDQNLSTWNFDYKDSQIILFPSQKVESIDEIALPVSTFFNVLQSSYLQDKDAELYKAYFEKKNQKLVALTFDDGPNPSTTNKALDILSKYGIKATFFVLGKNISGNEEILKRMKKDGHVIGNHSWSHPVLSKLSLEEAKKQITDTENALTKVLGSSSKLMRPPYGAITDDIRNSLDLSFIMWDVDSLDWKSKNETSILTEVQRQVHSGSIVLLHDIHGETVNALPKIIDYLKGQGYSFVTIPDLLDTRLRAHQLFYSRDQ